MIRNFNASSCFEILLVAAVAAILVMRLVLQLTGYPQMGGATLHIAHLLPGGLLMIASMLMLVAYLGRGTQYLAAFLGGVGFGLFMDEVGKVITQDNDYFFRPAISVMYVVFVLTFMAIQTILRREDYTAEETRINQALDLAHRPSSALSRGFFRARDRLSATYLRMRLVRDFRAS